jgi:hypothetical protein
MEAGRRGQIEYYLGIFSEGLRKTSNSQTNDKCIERTRGSFLRAKVSMPTLGPNLHSSGCHGLYSR